MKRNYLLGTLALAAGAAAVVALTPAFASPSRHGRDGGMQMGGRGFEPGFDFAALDTDGDGKLTEVELMAHRQAEIAGMDADGDGLISQAELTEFTLARMRMRAEAMASARISEHDSDGDGKLSAAEMQMPPMAGRMFSRLDSDGDGAISQAEMSAMRNKMAAHGGRKNDRKKWFGWGKDTETDD